MAGDAASRSLGENHSYIPNLETFPFKNPSKTLWERECPRRPSEGVSVDSGRKDLRTWGGGEPGPGCKIGQMCVERPSLPYHKCLLERPPQGKGLGGCHTSRRVCPEPRMRGEVRGLICERDGLNHPPAYRLLGGRKPLLGC